MSKYLEIAIPVLNEENRLDHGIRTTVNFLRINGLSNCGLVIADNGSTDRTEELSHQLCDEFPEVSYLKVPRRGVGLALQSCWRQSDAQIVGYMDVDLATDLKHINNILTLFSNPLNDIIVGSRLKKGATVSNRSFVREITSRCFNGILKLILGCHFTDGMCGFKYFRREIVLDIMNCETSTEGWFFCTELLVKSEWKGISISEIPIDWCDNTDSRVKIINLSKYYLCEIFRLKKDKKRWCNRYVQ